ncbi:hypothetical protein ACUTQ5_06370 [Serratia sp. NA_112.1]|uniref:hypothetical protein n=1 Tax=Serratia sp. NA_112.1 TaxID=3415665 RepID=UPI004046FD7C
MADEPLRPSGTSLIINANSTKIHTKNHNILHKSELADFCRADYRDRTDNLSLSPTGVVCRNRQHADAGPALRLGEWPDAVLLWRDEPVSVVLIAERIIDLMAELTYGYQVKKLSLCHGDER